MIDTHSHVATNIEGLEFVVLSGSNIENSKKNIKESKKNNKLLASIGIHPQETGSIEELEKLMGDEVVAIGECGLDYSLVESQKSESLKVKEEMENIFRLQIEISIKYNKALIVHSREASEETLEILKSYQNLRGVIHCYTGGKKRIKNYLELGENWYFGIDGNVTYEDGLAEVVKNIPKDRLVLETDSPYLSPVPHRGEENRPEYVKHIYQKIAEIWGMSFTETEKIIDENARKLFGVQSP